MSKLDDVNEVSDHLYGILSGTTAFVRLSCKVCDFEKWTQTTCNKKFFQVLKAVLGVKLRSFSSIKIVEFNTKKDMLFISVEYVFNKNLVLNVPKKEYGNLSTWAKDSGFSYSEKKADLPFNFVLSKVQNPSSKILELSLALRVQLVAKYLIALGTVMLIQDVDLGVVKSSFIPKLVDRLAEDGVDRDLAEAVVTYSDELFYSINLVNPKEIEGSSVEA